MALDERQKILSPYERQLKHGDLPPAGWLFLGPNSASYWDMDTSAYSVVMFNADYEQPLLPTVGIVKTPRGKSLVHELPRMVKEEFVLKIKDYDEDLLDQFKEWHYGRDELRLISIGDWFAEGYISNIPISRPRPMEFVMTFAASSMFVYRETVTPFWLLPLNTFNVGVVPYVYQYGGTS